MRPGGPVANAQPVTAQLDVLCLGEALWDLCTPRGRTLASASSLRLAPGGAAVNVALALARLGWRAGLAATVGADALGEALAARVAASGVSTDLVRRAPPRTGLMFREQIDRAQRIVGYRQPDEEAPVLPEGWRARALVLTGILPAEAQAASFGAAARAARRCGARVVADLNARPRVWRGRAGAPLPAWIGDADVIKASADDLEVMGLAEATLRAAMRPPAVLVVTSGPGATRARGPFGEIERAPVPIAGGGAMGAGDAFVAGLCDALLRGGGADAAWWERALRRGHALARRRVGRS